MTQTIVIGKPLPKPTIPITFEFVLDRGGPNKRPAIYPAGLAPIQYKYVELISRGHFFDNDHKDLMFAYDDPNVRDKGALYIGQWNDGVVE